MSARPASNNIIKKQHQLDAEAIQRREMADAAFAHWKKQKDKELLKKLVKFSDKKRTCLIVKILDERSSR